MECLECILERVNEDGPVPKDKLLYRHTLVIQNTEIITH